MASFTEEFLEEIEEVQDDFKRQFEALKDFTLNRIRESRAEIKQIKDRLDAVEEKVSQIGEKVDTSILDSSALEDVREEIKTLRESTLVHEEIKESSQQIIEEPTPVIKRQKLMHSTPVGKSSPPSFLDDIKDQELKEKLKPHYPDKVSTPERLTRVQLAYIKYWFFEKKKGEFSARVQVINELHLQGVKDGLWAVNYTPQGIKGDFKMYLKEKIRNMYKKKQHDDLTDSLLKELENPTIEL